MNFYIIAFLLLFTISSSLLFPHNHLHPKTANVEKANIVFKSTDGGQSWQDISKGLPQNLQVDSMQGNSFFANDKGLYVRVGKELYHNSPKNTASFWTATVFFEEHSSTDSARQEMPANNYWGVNLKTRNGTDVWFPVFDKSSEPRMRSVFETVGGSVFIGTDKGFFKTDNSGKTWKHVYDGGWAGNMAESNGVLLSTSKRRIIRSTDNGENWELLNSEISLTTWDIKQVRGGFTAISSSSASGTRILRTSYDGGKTWQPTEAGLQKVVIDSIWRTWNDRPRVQAFQTSIIRVGENFFSIHPDGIFKSTDKGKTWNLLLPSVEGKSFNLLISGNVIYAVPSTGGC